MLGPVASNPARTPEQGDRTQSHRCDKMADTINERIKVYIRQRPELSTDNPNNKENADNNQTALQPGVKSYSHNGDCLYYSSTSKKYSNFKFEGVLSPTITQVDVYDIVAKPIVESALKGYPGTIFAYGPTNSGKTHTIRGGLRAELGIMPRCIEDLLIATSGGRGQLFVSYLQIYCEVISDLLSPTMSQTVGTTNPSPFLSAEESAALSSSSSSSAASSTTPYNNPTTVMSTNQLSIRERAGAVFVEGIIPSQTSQSNLPTPVKFSLKCYVLRALSVRFESIACHIME